MTREQHMQWCKDRALEIVEKGDLAGAWTSMVSDLNKHDETRGHVAIEMGMMLLMSQNLDTKDKMRKLIEDFG